MIDLGLLVLVLIAAAAGGLSCLRALGALPADEADWLVPGVALSGDVVARFLNAAFGVLTALALASLARRHVGADSGPATGALFFTLPINWSLMTRAGSDIPVVLYAVLATGALLDWMASDR